MAYLPTSENYGTMVRKKSFFSPRRGRDLPTLPNLLWSVIAYTYPTLNNEDLPLEKE